MFTSCFGGLHYYFSPYVLSFSNFLRGNTEMIETEVSSSQVVQRLKNQISVNEQRIINKKKEINNLYNTAQKILDQNNDAERDPRFISISKRVESEENKIKLIQFEIDNMTNDIDLIESNEISQESLQVQEDAMVIIKDIANKKTHFEKQAEQKKWNDQRRTAQSHTNSALYAPGVSSISSNVNSVMNLKEALAARNNPHSTSTSEQTTIDMLNQLNKTPGCKPGTEVGNGLKNEFENNNSNNINTSNMVSTPAIQVSNNHSSIPQSTNNGHGNKNNWTPLTTTTNGNTGKKRTQKYNSTSYLG